MKDKRHFAKRPEDTSWDKVAGWYDQHVTGSSDFHTDVIIPGALRLMDPQRGQKILDLGCGQGVFSGILSEAGVSVTGIDSSKKLIDIAKKRSPRAEFLIGDATKLTGMPSGHYDQVVSILSLTNMDPLEDVIRQSARVLKQGGRLLIVINHPCFRIPRQSGWGFDEKRKLQYRRVDSYMTPMRIPIKMHPGAAPDVITWTFHRPISLYVQRLYENGLKVERLEEWVSHRKSLPGKLSRTENRSREEIPMFIALQAIKD